MIKISKRPIKYGTTLKVSREAAGDSKILTRIIKDLKKNRKLPRNTLRISNGRCEMGYCFDDVVRNQMTIRLEYFVITFKR